MKIENVIKNAVNAAKRLKKESEGSNINNESYKPRVIIYKNGYKVMMYCNYGSPQNIWVREKRYKSDMGQMLIDYTFISKKIDKLVIENYI